MKFNGTGILTSLCFLLFSYSGWAIDNPLLSYVPADTMLFSGNTEQVSIYDFPVPPLDITPGEPLSNIEKQQLGVSGRFFYELYQDLQRTITASSTDTSISVFKNHYGLSEQLAFVFYTQGISPVIRVRLEQEQNFLAILDKASGLSGLNYQPKQYLQQKYRSYPIDGTMRLIVSISDMNDKRSDKIATLALIPDNLSEQELSLLLGITQPVQSLAVTNKLAGIAQDNHYLPVSVNFIDFEQVLLSFYEHKTNSIGAWLTGMDNHLSAWQTPECKEDMLKLVKEVPRLTVGFTRLNNAVSSQEDNISQHSEMNALLEIKNRNVRLELNRFRGFIPDYVRKGSEQNIFAFAVGANFSQLAPMFFYVSESFKNTAFKCRPLLKLQDRMAKTNPAMVALMTGVVDGLHGIAFALQKLKLVQQSPENITSENNSEVSFLFSIATEYPQQIWRMISGFSPATALVTPSKEPQRLNFPELEPYGIELYLAIMGEHLVLYSGQPAQQLAQKLVNEPISANGLIYESIDYSALSEAAQHLKQSINKTGKEKNTPAEGCIYFDETLARLSRMSGTMVYNSDFTERGWHHSLVTDIVVRTPVTKSLQLAGKYHTYFVDDGCRLIKDGVEELLEDGTGFYQKYSEDGQCVIFETRYYWTQSNARLQFQYLREHSRPQGVCSNEFEPWAVPQAEYLNDSCDLAVEKNSAFACFYHWDGTSNKTVYKQFSDK